jgi:hypothetical protein
MMWNLISMIVKIPEMEPGGSYVGSVRSFLRWHIASLTSLDLPEKCR